MRNMPTRSKPIYSRARYDGISIANLQCYRDGLLRAVNKFRLRGRVRVLVRAGTDVRGQLLDPLFGNSGPTTKSLKGQWSEDQTISSHTTLIFVLLLFGADDQLHLHAPVSGQRTKKREGV